MLNDRAVFFCHGLHTAHEFLVFALRVIDQRHRGCSTVGQLRHFTGVVHAQLQHRHAVVLTQPQQGQWHAYVVVEITLGGQCICGVQCMQYGSDHLRHGGFAVAASHRNQWNGELSAPRFGQCLQSQQRVVYFDACQTCCGQSVVRNGHLDTRCGQTGQKIMGVKCVATQSHKQIVRFNTAAVGVYPGHRQLWITDDAAGG